MKFLDKCSVPGCGKPIQIKDARLCRRHYNRQWRGQPFELPPKVALEVKFANFYTKSRDTDCWPFIGGKDPDGYGIFQYSGKQYRAPRLSWILHRGPIPRGLMVLHRCDNPPCVNPDHLFLGTGKDNSDDMMAKRRWSGSPTTKLTPAQVADIRARTRTDCHFVRDLSLEFGISNSQIRHILSGRCWRNDEAQQPSDKRIGAKELAT